MKKTRNNERVRLYYRCILYNFII